MGTKDDLTTRQTETTHEEIAIRAYGLWEQRGSPFGSPEEDWFRAEEQIRSESAPSAETAGSLTAKAQSASA